MKFFTDLDHFTDGMKIVEVRMQCGNWVWEKKDKMYLGEKWKKMIILIFAPSPKLNDYIWPTTYAINLSFKFREFSSSCLFSFFGPWIDQDI